MKISIEIDCSPQEARTFLGLPDLEPLHQAFTARMQEQMTQYLANMDYAPLLKTWLSGGVQSMEQLQSLFWSQIASLGKRRSQGERPMELMRTQAIISARKR